jgi:hypothetical protein
MLVVWVVGEWGCPGHAASVGELMRKRIMHDMPIMERHAVSGGGGMTTHFDIKRKQSEEAIVQPGGNSVRALFMCQNFPFLNSFTALRSGSHHQW